MTEWIGRTLSKVEIRSLLGRGGMADVYLGRHITLNRDVAVKVLQSHLSDDASFLSRFTSEAQSVAAMRHPNIVQVFDFDLADDRPYMVMELLQGLSLRSYLVALRSRGQVLPLATVKRLIAGLAAALDYAHARGIIHRDIKPANIMLRSEHGQVDPAEDLPHDTEPVLTDFGVARVANAIVQTASGQIVGTPAYMSPEQVQGQVVDARSDIYSLGIVLYEMLTNELPFDSDTQASILIKHLTEPVPPLPAHYASLQPVVDRALAKTAALRFQKASDLAEALAKAPALPADSSSLPTGEFNAAIFDPSTAQINTPTPTSPAANTPAVTPTSTQQATGTSGLNPLWIVAGVGTLGLIVGIVALLFAIRDNIGGLAFGATPTLTETATVTAEPGEIVALGGTPETVQPAQGPIGMVVFQDTDVRVTLDGLQPPPEGSAYEAWLTDPDASPISLGLVEVVGGKASIDFAEPEDSNLLATFSGFAISLEPDPDTDPAMSEQTLYAAEVPPEVIQATRLLLEVSGGTEIKSALIAGLNMEAKHYNSHVGYTIEAINTGNLDGAKLHAEHIINIVAGREGPEYDDWNDNGRPDNPGDAVGLRPYLLIIQAAILGVALDPQGSMDVHAAASDAVASVDTLLDAVNDAVRLAGQVANADEIDAVTELAADLEELRMPDAFTTLSEQADALDLVITVEVLPAAR